MVHASPCKLSSQRILQEPLTLSVSNVAKDFSKTALPGAAVLAGQRGLG
jgi:hypothetical protein